MRPSLRLCLHVHILEQLLGLKPQGLQLAGATAVCRTTVELACGILGLKHLREQPQRPPTGIAAINGIFAAHKHRDTGPAGTCKK